MTDKGSGEPDLVPPKNGSSPSVTLAESDSFLGVFFFFFFLVGFITGKAGFAPPPPRIEENKMLILSIEIFNNCYTW